MSIFHDLYDIFFDEKVSSPKILPMSKLEEYKNELEEVFFDEIFVATKYDEIKKILERYKFYSERNCSCELSTIFETIFVEQMSKFVEQNMQNWVITSVPMHWTRYFLRGFDHMKLLGKKTSQKLKIPYFPLLGTKFTRRQVKLSRQNRLKNRENVYFVKKLSQIPENIILLDDVVSTASSVNMCAKVLKNAGAKRIVVFVLATNK